MAGACEPERELSSDTGPAGRWTWTFWLQNCEQMPVCCSSLSGVVFCCDSMGGPRQSLNYTWYLSQVRLLPRHSIPKDELHTQTRSFCCLYTKIRKPISGCWVSFEGDEKVLKLVLTVAQLCKYAKKLSSCAFLTSEFHGMWIVFQLVCYFFLKKHRRSVL